MKIGFLGVGNMGGAIVKGIISSGFIKPDNIFIYDKNNKTQEMCVKNNNVNSCSSYEELLLNVDILLVGVKPNVSAQVLSDISDLVKKYKPLIVSMIAGITLDSIQDMLGFETQIIRIMPNINILVSESTTAICPNKSTSDKNIQIITSCFESVGYVFPLDESSFSVFTAIACCSPAFTYMYIDSLAKGALKLGMNKKTAIKIVAQSLLGSAKMILNSDEHPYELVDKVCSPGGSTIEGVCTLSKNNFESTLVDAIDACVNKDKRISNK